MMVSWLSGKSFKVPGGLVGGFPTGCEATVLRAEAGSPDQRYESGLGIL
jgi:hypothetical protein